jgi:hypothetical protein
MDEAFKQAFINHPVGIILSIGFILLCFYIGLTLLYYGWPKFKK